MRAQGLTAVGEDIAGDVPMTTFDQIPDEPAPGRLDDPPEVTR